MPSSSSLAALAFAAGFAATAALAHDHSSSRGRLVFADHEKPVVRVLDLDSGEVTHSFDVPKRNPSLAAVEGGRYVVIQTGDEEGTVRILDSGLRYEDHGDHVDIDKGAVRLLDFSTRGDRPAHVVSAHGWLALFYDGVRPWERKSEAKAVLIDVASLDRPKIVSEVWRSAAPQHGIAVPLGRRQWLMSVPNPVYAKGEDRSASSRPDGFEILERGKGWRTVASFNDPARAGASCKLFHGHAELDGRQVFGCNEGADGGLLVIGREAGRNWTARKLAYPDGRRSSTIKARAGGRYMVGNYGLQAPYDALLRIDPAAATLTAADVLPLPDGQPACQFKLGRGGKRLAKLTPDGKLRVYEMEPAWREVAAFDAVPAFDCKFGAPTPTPKLAVVGQSAFVSDPVNSRIREFHLDSLKQGLDMPVGGQPANLAGDGDAG